MTNKEKAIIKTIASYAFAYYLVAIMTFGVIYNETQPIADLCIEQTPMMEWSCNWKYANPLGRFFKSALWPFYGTGRVAIWITK